MQLGYKLAGSLIKRIVVIMCTTISGSSTPYLCARKSASDRFLSIKSSQLSGPD